MNSIDKEYVMRHLLESMIGLIAALCMGTAFAAERDSPVKTAVEVVTVSSQNLESSLRLAGEFRAFEAVDMYAKESGYLEKVFVDRGSIVNKGDVLAQLAAPELVNRLEAARADYLAASDQHTRLNKAAAQEGIVAPVQLESSKQKMESGLRNMRAMEDRFNYLTVRAPFDGVISQRNLDTGALVVAGGSTGAMALFRLESIGHLRLIVAVPESSTGAVRAGAAITFSVAAFPQEQFKATISRRSRSLDPKTRTESVELDYDNSEEKLSPGMYADVMWPVVPQKNSFAIPLNAIATTTERTFVIRIVNGKAEWVDVRRGHSFGKFAEVFGELRAGDTIAALATDELKDGAEVEAKSSNAQ